MKHFPSLITHNTIIDSEQYIIYDQIRTWYYGYVIIPPNHPMIDYKYPIGEVLNLPKTGISQVGMIKNCDKKLFKGWNKEKVVNTRTIIKSGEIKILIELDWIYKEKMDEVTEDWFILGFNTKHKTYELMGFNNSSDFVIKETIKLRNQIESWWLLFLNNEQDN